MPYWKRLQPLRIPGGWTVMFHKLEDLEPEELPPEDRDWLFLFIYGCKTKAKPSDRETKAWH